MGNVLLVHGAWGGGWSWDKIAGPLRDLGHNVAVTELHRGSLAGDVAAAQSDAESLGGPVVACGWSYGGMVITGLDLPEGSHLVYVTAMMPDEGESVMGTLSTAPSDANEIISPTDDGHVVLDLERFPEVICPDVPTEEAAAAAKLLRPQAIAPLMESPARIAWKEHDSTYVVCTQDKVITPELQRRMAARAKRVEECESSHAPLFSQPAHLIKLLDEIATA